MTPTQSDHVFILIIIIESVSFYVIIVNFEDVMMTEAKKEKIVSFYLIIIINMKI